MRAFPRSFRSLPLLLALLCALAFISAQAGAQESRPLVRVATIDGPITPVVARYIERAVRTAERDNANALVILLDTPGGEGGAMDDIVDDILNSDVPVVVYVSPVNARAASAGVYITLAAHVAAMAPSTNIGSATPVLVGSTGSIGSDEAMERKVLNDAVARITNLATIRGRNVEWAVSAVRDAANITADEAVALGVVDLVAPDLTALLSAIDGRVVETAAGPVTLSTANAQTSAIGMSVIERSVQFLANPTIAYLLVTFGLIALFTELANPGATLPGVLGLVSLVLGLVGLGSLPVVWLGLGLMLLAFVLFVVDIFVPSLGLLTIGGLASFLIGSNILIADGTPDDLQISRPIIWTVTACIALAAFGLGALIVRSQVRAPKAGKQAMIGQVGTARSNLGPKGQVLVFGEIWNAESTDGPIAEGSPVLIERIAGLKAYVRLATEAERDMSRDIGDRRTVIPVQ